MTIGARHLNKNTSDELIMFELHRQALADIKMPEGGEFDGEYEPGLEEILRRVDVDTIMPIGQYLIDFPIEISEGVTLTIDPGTNIYFGPNAGITAYGILRAVGTEEQPILFNSKDSIGGRIFHVPAAPILQEGAERRWHNITFRGSGTIGSRLEYCTITGGSGNSDYSEDGKREGGAVLVSEAAPTIVKCRITTNAAYRGGGIYVERGSPTIRGNEIVYNIAGEGAGLFLEESAADVERNEFTRNDAHNLGGGIMLSNSNEYARQISRNLFQGNSADIGSSMYHLPQDDKVKEILEASNEIKEGYVTNAEAVLKS